MGSSGERGKLRLPGTGLRAGQHLLSVMGLLGAFEEDPGAPCPAARSIRCQQMDLPCSFLNLSLCLKLFHQNPIFALKPEPDLNPVVMIEVDLADHADQNTPVQFNDILIHAEGFQPAK